MLELRTHRPHWSTHLYFGSGPDILERLDAGHLDCIVTSAPIAKKEWESAFLHEEYYALCASPDLLADSPMHSVHDAKDHRLLDLDPSLPLARYLTSLTGELSFQEVWFLGSASAVLEFVLAKQGVAVLPVYMVRQELEQGALVPLLPEYELLKDSFRLLWRRGAVLERTFRELAEWLTDRELR